jgi:hypothetical protein
MGTTKNISETQNHLEDNVPSDGEDDQPPVHELPFALAR